MTQRPAVTDTASEPRPSFWAVALLLISAAFAILSVALLTTGYGLG